MSDILQHIYNACDPLKPATPEYYLDCSEARGSNALTKQFLSQLTLATESNCLFLFSGFIGSGKSSELAQLKYDLQHPKTSHTHKCHLPILVDVTDYLDLYDVAATDILLAIMTEIAATLREEVKIELAEKYIAKRMEELKEFLLSDVDITDADIEIDVNKLVPEAMGKLLPGIPFKAKVKVQRLRADPDNRKKVREALQHQTGSLLEEINLILDAARLEVRKLKDKNGNPLYRDIVLIVDNLEKIRKLEGVAEGLDSQRELFLERSEQLRSINAHVIYTVPLRLVRSADAGALQTIYGTTPFVLPMIKVRERRSNNTYAPGMDALRQLLKKRFGSFKVEDVFTPGALDALLIYSGGSVRRLMEYVRSGCSYALQNSTVQVNVKEAHQAIRQTVGLYNTLPQLYWEKLALLELSANQEIPLDQDYLSMFGNLIILEYLNGDSSDDWLASAAPWYAVNPIVRELQQFKEAVAKETARRQSIVNQQNNVVPPTTSA